MKIVDILLRRGHDPKPSTEALKARAELKYHLRPRAEAAADERRRLLRENNFAPRIQAIYRGEA